MEQVPETLKAYIGQPQLPQVDPESWQRETELIQQDNLDPEVREALAELDRETAMIAEFRGKPIRLEQHEYD
jgi:hypothetical protein